jgi:hypothetical protein
MKVMKALLQILALLLATGTAVVHAGDVYVICNTEVHLQAGDIRDMFLGETQFIGALRLQPADNSAAQAAFLEKALKMDAGKYATAWTKKSFREGLNAPALKGTDAEALDFVRHTAGACSYTSTVPGPGVTLIARF